MPGRRSRLAALFRVNWLRLLLCYFAVKADAQTCATSAGMAQCSSVQSFLNEEGLALLKTHGISITPISPMGSRVVGFDLRSQAPEAVLQLLQKEMASRGFLVFAGQGVLSGDEQVTASKLWGGREMHSTHGVHPEAPNKHIFRLSNDQRVGILGVGPQWHNDGSFEIGVFSHVGYHIVRVPEQGGNTMFAHQGAAYDALPAKRQDYWSKLVSVNSNSGVLHPMVHDHPISGRRSVWLHLGMTGGVLQKLPNDEGFRLLKDEELREIFHEYNDLLNAGLPENGGNYAISYPYETGDCIFIDNLAISHKASPEAHSDAASQGLRILQRTTVKAMQDFLPGFGLPPVATRQILMDANPSGEGFFEGGGIGYRWDESIRMQN
eukprot:TRINITY_DN7471_c0_g1_i2.p1 TRINITY_DN7471_c0_g1~~TRINITY_DN7471_c0_g1_i2.p1  ORF type:complete len:379 (+),score=51.97 TRINITY_DN7471_c0_g1_i2:85-1221(+)